LSAEMASSPALLGVGIAVAVAAGLVSPVAPATGETVIVAVGGSEGVAGSASVAPGPGVVSAGPQATSANRTRN
ncbi:MAG: hypothetical protein L0331_09610, partial [Chloroflexi bacterium]|nr:hypothetical protein [Chloroflexota bacterium]